MYDNEGRIIVHNTKRKRYGKRILPSPLCFSLPLIWIIVSGTLGWVLVDNRKPKNILFGEGTIRQSDGGLRSAVFQTETSDDTKPITEQNSQKPSSQQQQQRRKGLVGPEQLNHLKEQVDIISMLESYNLGQFRRTGTNRATAICPFHDDHNPSLSIDGERRLYKCFSCGAGGDVFRFVREFNKIKNGEEMSFMQAVRIVDDYSTGMGNPNIMSPVSRMSEEELKKLEAKKGTLFAMNQAAATFYVNCLTLPFAGGARSYLRSRGFQSPSTARAFAVGYAPDVYFRGRAIPEDQKSLVSHLQSQNFSASEIVEAGLAIRVKKNANKSDNTNTTTSPAAEEDQLDFSSIMDRFRGRLVVPIFDSTGERVLAFGGRILPETENERTNFKAPKYMNSPESLVFSKKNVLFGHHMAVNAFQREKKSGGKAKQLSSGDPLLIVEGYMDVMALWDIGFRSAVASMGTALSLEQLTAAAKIAGANDGRVILCLDNDEAGLAAVERLCTGSFFMKATGSHNVQFLIASLPTGLKDPGDFIDFHLNNNKDVQGAAERFRHEVVNTAKSWPDWFIDRLLARYDKDALQGSVKSFGGIFQRVAEFLASFPNPADRTKSAYIVADNLARIMAEENNATSVSNAARMQFESDLIETAARIATAKDAMKQRIENAQGGSSAETNALLFSLSRGSGSDQSTEDTSKLSYKALKATKRQNREPLSFPTKSAKRGTARKIGLQGPPQKRTYRPPKNQKVGPALTPHFSGFEFENQSDADWLGIPRNKWKRNNDALVLGNPEYDGNNDNSVQKRGRKVEPVYFNSNEYHGHRFISTEAIQAGYSDTSIARDNGSIREKGVATMLLRESDSSLEAAEAALLRSLVMRYPNSRNAVKDVLSASASVGQVEEIAWSSYDRKWLFTSLVEEDLSAQLDNNAESKLEALRALLAAREDAPPGAFAETAATRAGDDAAVAEGAGDGTDNPEYEVWDRAAEEALISDKPPPGSLDCYFVPVDDFSREISVLGKGSVEETALQEKAALAAQEHFMTLLSASAAKRQHRIIDELKAVSFALDARMSSGVANMTTALTSPSNEESGSSMETSSNDVHPLNSSMAGAVSSGDFVGAEPSFTPSEPSPAEHEVLLNNPTALRFKDMSDNEMGLYCKEMLGELQKVTARRNEFDKSARRITERLMRLSSGSSAENVEGRLSIPLQKKIARQVDDYLAEVEYNKTNARENPEESDTASKTDNLLLEGADGDSDVKGGGLEAELQRIESEWGDWSADDYIWEPDHACVRGHRTVNGQHSVENDDSLDDDDGETLEEALARMDIEWRKWQSD